MATNVLQNGFSFSQADLEENRHGELSLDQKERLMKQHQGETAVTMGIIGVVTAALVIAATIVDSLALGAAAVIIGGALVIYLRRQDTTWPQIARREVEAVTGKVTDVTCERGLLKLLPKAAHSVTVEGRGTLRLGSERECASMMAGQYYTFYVLPRTQLVVSLEESKPQQAADSGQAQQAA